MSTPSDRTRVLILAVLAGFLAIGPASALTVQEAYEEMQHRHAGLDPTSAGFTREEAAYLSRLFELVDLAIVEKMQAWTWFQSEGRRGKPVQEYTGRIDALIGILDGLPAPEKLRDAKRLLVEAIRDQRAYFQACGEALAVGASGGDNREEHRAKGAFMKSSSQKLHQVYAQLMTLFPAAGQQNFDAFYDHLCVLDLL